MMFWRFISRRGWAGLGLGLICALAGAWGLTPSSVVGTSMVRASYDSLYSLFFSFVGPVVPDEAVIIYIDVESHHQLGVDQTQPWPRELHAALLDRLVEAGARAVVFDVVFGESGRDPRADGMLAAAMDRQGGVVLAAELSVSSQGSGEGAWGRITRVDYPAKKFLDAAAFCGLGELGIDEDFVCRRIFSGIVVGEDFMPGIALATARVLGGRSGDNTAGWLQYYGPPFTLPHLSYSQALDPSVADEGMFRDKVIFVGARPKAGLVGERRDEFRSPFRSWGDKDVFLPGVEVHATQFLNLWREEMFFRWPFGVEAGVLLFAGFGLGFLFLRLQPVKGLMVGGAMVLASAGACMLAVGVFRTWIPWLLFAGLQVPVALGGSFLVRSVEWYRDRRRMEAERRRSEMKIREQARLIESAHDAILMLNREGEVTYANSGCERLYGWSVEELMQGAGRGLFQSGEAQQARCLAMQRGDWRGELRQVVRGGEVKEVESSWTRLLDEQGGVKGLLLINSDITERKKLEAQAMRLQRTEAIGSMAGGMAHDLNNALAPVLMGIQRLRRGLPVDESERILGLMEAGTRRGAEMVKQVLLFARGRDGQMESLKPGALLGEIERLVRDTFPKSINISIEVQEGLWSVRGNATQLHQVLLNLAVNARDAMASAGGSLLMAMENVQLEPGSLPQHPDAKAGQFVVCSVVDTGCGMEAEVLGRIFEPFFTTKEEGVGTGLGLSTSFRIVKGHGGFLTCRSEPGEGSTFELYLPRELGEGNGDAGSAARGVELQGHGEVLLVADDDAAIREMVAGGLEAVGFRVVQALNGVDAVSQHKACAGEVVMAVVDVHMAHMPGREAVRVMRELNPNLKVVLLSGSLDGRMTDAQSGDGEEYRVVQKPFSWDELLAVISQQLRG
jgi:PAS domain S-box-containing protein